jgi:hypothetical protein
MTAGTQSNLVAYCALCDVLNAVGGRISRLVIPDPPKAVMSGYGVQHEKGFNGYSRARIDVRLRSPHGEHTWRGAHGRTIEEAARSLLINHPSVRPPLRAALAHAAQKAGLQR